MPQTVVRIYATQDTADAAVSELREHGFKARALESEHAGVYAPYIQQGEVPVVVDDPLFGEAGFATRILESHNPVKLDLSAVEPNHDLKVDWQSPTPLSSLLGWNVLLDDPTPLSASLKQPVLTAESSSSATLKQIRKQSDHPAPISSTLRIPLLYEKPGLLSTRFGWRLLSNDAAPLSERFGWRLISNNPTPVSTKFRWRVLLDNPAPLSSFIGLKVLA